MDIKYMKKMEKTPLIDESYNEGMSNVEIVEIENEIGKKFPLAYKEFLLLGGKGANMIADMDHSLLSFVTGEPYWKDVRERCLESMAEEKVDPKGDIWIFAALGSEQCHFFYFDGEEDPQIYFYCAFFDNEDGTEYAGIQPMKYTFSEYINEQIDERKISGY
jgi:hypothetical protein